jgi:ribosomal protein S12 methylthiotransferase accessory factor
MWREIVHTMPGPGRVDSDFGGCVVPSDHPPDDAREGRAPEPWFLFLASIGSCMASFVADACRQRGLPTDGIRLVQRQDPAEEDDTVPEVAVGIEVPEDFSKDDRRALAEAAAACTVKRVLESPPTFRIEVTTAAEPPAPSRPPVDPGLYPAIVESLKAPVLVADIDHVIRYMNRAAIEHYSEGEALIGRSLLDCHDEESRRVIRRVLPALQAGEDERLITDDEKWRIWMRAIRDPSGRVIGYYERYGLPQNPDQPDPR